MSESKINLELHYTNILKRMDIMVEAAKAGKTVVASEINEHGGRSWSRCYYIFINDYTKLKTGLSLAEIVCAKNGDPALGAAFSLKFIYKLGDGWDLIGRPSFDEFKSWFYGPWLKLHNCPEFRKAQAQLFEDSGAVNEGYNARIFVKSARNL